MRISSFSTQIRYLGILSILAMDFLFFHEITFFKSNFDARNQISSWIFYKIIFFKLPMSSKKIQETWIPIPLYNTAAHVVKSAIRIT